MAKKPKPPAPVERKLIYDRNEPYKVSLQACNDHGCGVFTYDATPVKASPDVAKGLPFRFFGFKDNIEPSDTVLAQRAPENLYCLAHMYIPPFFDELETQREVPPANRGNIALDNVLEENGFLGLFILKLFRNYPKFSQPACRKRGQFGCPELLHLPTEFSLVQTAARKSNKNKQKGGVLGHFTFNGMNFYPFLMIDYTVCYYVCDAGGTYDWNRRPDGTFKTPSEIFPNVAIDAPISYDATLGIYLTRAAHLAPDPPAIDKNGRV